MSEEAVPVAEYVDANGNTWQLTEEMAKRLGYSPAGEAAVEAKVVEAKVVEAEPKKKPAPARRTATTK